MNTKKYTIEHKQSKKRERLVCNGFRETFQNYEFVQYHWENEWDRVVDWERTFSKDEYELVQKG